MHWIPAKLRQIRQDLGLTQLKAAEASGLSQRDVSQLENGRKEGIPKEYIRFLHSRGIDLNWLFTDPAAGPSESGTAADSRKAYALAEDQPAALVREDSAVGYHPPAQRPLVSEAAIRMVDAAAGAQYPRRRREPAFLQDLPVLALPLAEVREGTFRCFQVAGAAMRPTLQPQDWVIGCLVAAPESGELYVVVTADSLVVTRVFPDPVRPAVLRLRPDAAEQPETELPLAGVRELWQVRGRLSFQLAAPAAEQKLDSLAAGYQDLLDRVQRLERGQ